MSMITLGPVNPQTPILDHWNPPHHQIWAFGSLSQEETRTDLILANGNGGGRTS